MNSKLKNKIKIQNARKIQTNLTSLDVEDNFNVSYSSMFNLTYH